jgi:hypothetical protein
MAKSHVFHESGRWVLEADGKFATANPVYHLLSYSERSVESTEMLLEVCDNSVSDHGCGVHAVTVNGPDDVGFLGVVSERMYRKRHLGCNSAAD